MEENKVVGHRKIALQKGFPASYADFAGLLLKFRKDGSFGVRTGVYKFKTFEEADEWLDKNLTRDKKSAGPRPSKT